MKFTKAIVALVAATLSTTAKADGPFSWTGLYLGGHAGYARAVRSAELPAPFLPGSYSEDRNGYFGGALAGYNYQIGSWVLGAEIDATWASLEPRQTVGVPASTVQWHTYSSVDFIASARLRAGYAFNRWHVYGTGGAAWMQGSATLVVTDAGIETGRGSASTDHFGWVVGTGFEYAATGNISLRFEYLHYDFSASDYNYVAVPASTSAAVTIDTIRAAATYKF